MIDFKSTMLRNVNNLTIGEAALWLHEYGRAEITIDQPMVRKLTGGYASQTINQITKQAVYLRSQGKRVTRKLLGV